MSSPTQRTLARPDSGQAGPGCTHELLLRLTIPGEPLPKQRARVLRTGYSYTPARTRQAEERIRLEVVAARGPGRDLDDAPRALTLRFYRGTGRTADLDNLVKLVKDALNGIAWRDDRQVIQLHASRFDRQADPRSEIAVYRIIPLTAAQPEAHHQERE